MPDRLDADTFDTLREALADRYELERELGAGGMATVYLAGDLKHERRVAIKVLKPELAAVIGAERFLAEIKTTANLQHPHILPLHDSGEADGFLFYVMPYVEGESLRERLDRERQLPVDEAVGIARAVALALEHAHGRGVVHRDIKPANILLQEGQPQVSDFGIALAVSAAGGGRLTETGMSLGSPLYMSPEQASADHDVTGRSDIYSLGCMLYEMLAGDPPHTGPNTQAILTRVLTEEPRPVADVRRSVTPHVASVTARALEKLPADRFEGGESFAAALDDATFRWPPDSSRAEAATLKRRLIAAVGVAAVMGGVALWGWLRPAVMPEARLVSRFSILVPEDQQLQTAGGRAFPFDLSRDGRRLVYVARRGAERQLFLREMESDELRALPGTEGARDPFFSPDAESIGFFADEQLQRVSLAGGAPLAIVEIGSEPIGASWGLDGTILYALVGSGLFRVPATRGGGAVPVQLSPVNAPLEGEADSLAIQAVGESARWPRFLPDGKHALVTTAHGTGVLDLDSGEFRYVISGSQAVYLPTGHLLYNAGQQRMRVVPFDLSSLDVTGPEAPAVENVFRGPGGGAIMARVSNTGTLVYVRGGFERSLVMVDRNGRAEPIDIERRGYRFPDISPSGDLIAVTVDPRPSDIWIVDLRRSSAERLTRSEHNIAATWAPGGDRLVFYRSDDQYWVPWPEGGEPQLLASRPLPQYWSTWLRDGRILVQEPNPETGNDLVALNPNDGSFEPFWITDTDESGPTASADGDWVAFTSNASGVAEVYVVPASLSSRPVQVSVGGGTEVRWSGDGTELLYRSGNSIMSVHVRTTPSFEAGVPVELFAGSFDFTHFRNWDVGPDGRFVMVRADPRTTGQFQVVLNWFEELEAGEGN